MADGMTGRSYLLRGEPVTVITRWATPPPCTGGVTWHRPPKRNAPRNVLLEFAGGRLTVRPFRGLRKIKETAMEMTRPDPVDREVPDGFHLVAVPEGIGHWRPAAGKPCRYARQGHVQCGEPSIAEVLRGDKRPQWWAYCGAHSYRRWVETGRVWSWILRADDDPVELAAAELDA